MISLTIFTLLCLNIVLWQWKKKKHNKAHYNLPPSPPKLPIIGNLHQMADSVTHRSLKSLSDRYGPVMQLHFGSRPMVIISSANAAEQLLKTNGTLFTERPGPSFGKRLLFNFQGLLFNSYGEKWRRIRGIAVSNLLNSKKIRSLRNVREEESERMLKSVTKSMTNLSSPICIRDVLRTLIESIAFRAITGERHESGGYLFREYSVIGACVNVGDFIPRLGWINHINGLEKKVNSLRKDVDAFK